MTPTSHGDGGFEPVLPFDVDDPQFARGFEAGRIWEMLRSGDYQQLDGQPFHAENAEMVLRMIEAEGYVDTLQADFTSDETWMVLRRA